MASAGSESTASRSSKDDKKISEYMLKVEEYMEGIRNLGGSLDGDAFIARHVQTGSLTLAKNSVYGSSCSCNQPSGSSSEPMSQERNRGHRTTDQLVM
ncbi:unnamed protein product [Dimorphilus gyrociliatus]|uniref:Uncharacterized protein n=1 Tax=Dimorphilus gyrociliatus TaxID=2664684 RepID=A0A7I8WDU8_9ANNE|nr:unnamed protein product [Dimorphilus gyrociliatus]